MNEEPRESDRADLRAQAEHARNVLERVAADGGVLQQIATGEWDGEIHPDRVADAADLIRAMSEGVRQTRVLLDAARWEPGSAEVAKARVAAMNEGWLPINRKERYYTGTVLPMIVASDGFAHLHRLLDLCGVPLVAPIEDDAGVPEIQFFTEYSLVESVIIPADVARFPGLPQSKDTPDLVLFGDSWLLAIEAKMFHRPTVQALNHQLAQQRVILDYLAERLDVRQENVKHVLLLPERFEVAGADVRVVTWEAVRARYRGVAPAYWMAVLDVALNGYKALKSRGPAFGLYSDASMTGSDIVQAYQGGDREFTYMGRAQGLTGPGLTKDIESGSWAIRVYEVRREPLSQVNWFPISDFVERITTSTQSS